MVTSPWYPRWFNESISIVAAAWCPKFAAFSTNTVTFGTPANNCGTWSAATGPGVACPSVATGAGVGFPCVATGAGAAGATVGGLAGGLLWSTLAIDGKPAGGALSISPPRGSRAPNGCGVGFCGGAAWLVCWVGAVELGDC